MEQLPKAATDIQLAQIKGEINSITNLSITSHSDAFDKIHKQLQQALTNLDGA